MKKCPFCAETIQDEAIVCRYCGRDLTPIAKVDEVNASIMPIETKPSFAEVMNLGEVFPQSWKPSVERLKEVMGLSNAMLNEVINPVFVKYLEHQILSEGLIYEEMQRVVAQSYMWSFACFGIGVEQGVGNLAYKTGMGYLSLVSRSFGLHLVYYLGKLVEKGVNSLLEAQSQSGVITNKVQSWGYRIEELGKKEFASVKQLNSNFLMVVNKLGDDSRSDSSPRKDDLGIKKPICPKCGSYNSPGAIHCQSCGEKLDFEK